MPGVVLAEDDQTMLTLLTTLLTLDGFDVPALESHEDILTALEHEARDRLVPDANVAHQNGLDATRGSAAACRTNVTMLSGTNVKHDCVRHGADGLLPKPVTPDDLTGMRARQLHTA